MTTSRKRRLASSGDTAIPSAEDYVRAAIDVHRHLDLDILLRSLGDHVAALSDADAAFVFSPRDGTERFGPLTIPDEEPHPAVEALCDVTRADIEELLGAGSEVVLQGLGPFGSPDSWPSAPPERSAALAVRGEDDRIVAVILLADVSSAGPDSRQGLHDLVGAVRPAVVNAVRVLGMKDLIIKDDTANCFNRRHFEESLPEELARAQRFRSPLSLIFFDLDNLKQVNSRHGHSMGSRTLYEVSVRVRSRVRKFDKLFRFGGDEFCILLPETEWHGALEVAERVRESIAGSQFLKGLVVDPEGIEITASFGIASYPLHARTKDDLIVQADRAMQRIKNATKNSIAIAEIVGSPDAS